MLLSYMGLLAMLSGFNLERNDVLFACWYNVLQLCVGLVY